MKTSTRLNLLLAGIGAAAIAISGALLWTTLDSKSVDDIRQAAQVQMRIAEAIRKYTVDYLQVALPNANEHVSQLESKYRR